jgi:hypothetical protein
MSPATVSTVAGLPGDLHDERRRGVVLPGLLLDDLDLVADDLLGEGRDAVGRLGLVDDHGHAGAAARDVDVVAHGLHRDAHLLAERRVGEHRPHVGGRGVVRHLVRELHRGALLVLGGRASS